MSKREPLTIEVAAERLSGIVSTEYKWPELLPGWQLEFIAYPEGDLDMDMLHPVSGVFWSDDNEPLPLPYKSDESPITVWDLIALKLPYMTTFGYATVVDKPKESHLSLVPGEQV